MINTKEKSRFFKALGEPVRLKIVDFLLNKKDCACICELAGLIKKDISVIFRHVKILEEAGIIKAEKKASFLMCCVKDKNKIMKYLED